MIRFFLFFLFLFCGAGCSEQSKGSVILLKNLKGIHTHCFGRHQLDLPADFFQADGLTATFAPPGLTDSDGAVNVEVVKSAITEEKFGLQVLARRAKILSAASSTTGVLKNERRIDSQAHLFTIQAIDDAYSTELHFILEGTYVVLTTPSYDNQFSVAERRVIELWRNFEKTASANLASSYCLGELSVRGKFAEEHADFSYRSVKLPDVKISIETNTYSRDERRSLLERMDGQGSLLKKFDAKNKVIRKGELDVASMKAQEWLSWIILGEDDNKKKQYGFALETRRAVPSPLQPQLHVELDTAQPSSDGVVHETTLTEMEIIGLWDFVTRSIRTPTLR